MKQILTFSAAAICMIFNLSAQEPQLFIEGAANIIPLESESFESGLGNFTNSGIVNWSTTMSEAQTGLSSATSNLVVSSQDAILSLNVNVPTGFTAILQFYVKASITHNSGQNKQNGRVAFKVDGAAEFTQSESFEWEQKTYYLTDGAHTLDWTAFHTSTASKDEVQMYLDDVLITYNESPSLRIVDGTEGMGKVLVSDEYGNAGWISLSAITDFDNTSGNALLPLVLDGNHQVTNTLTVKDANGVGMQSSSNLGNGIQTEANGQNGVVSNNNAASGVKAENNVMNGIEANLNLNGFKAESNTFDGFYAFNNGDNGFKAEGNSNDGFEALGNGEDGFRAENNGIDGFTAINNSDGFSAFSNTDDGFHAFNNTDDGFFADNNGDNGFSADNNGNNGFSADNNGSNGFSALNNGLDGFFASNNGGDGFQADNNTFDGFEANNNGDNGFESKNNAGNGFFASGNTFDGVQSNNNENGFEADNNVDNGYVSLNNGLSGFASFNNAGSGFWTVSNGGGGIFSASNTGDEGYFDGTVQVTGQLSKGSGSFKIDHPLDPANKFLYHSFVESPDMMNVYNGNVILDQNGEVVVKMEAWFEPLNREFRYQLTAIGAPGPNLYIAEEMQNNRFKIAGGTPGTKVSWQVTGIRQDPYAEQNRIEVEVEKPEQFKGYYLHHEAYRQAFEKSFSYVKLGYKTLEEIQAEQEVKH